MNKVLLLMELLGPLHYSVNAQMETLKWSRF